MIDAERLHNSRMITFITPLRWFGPLWLRPLFVLTRAVPKLTGIGPMNVVHFTHWSLLTDIPYNGPPQVRERPAHPYLVWGSVFNGEVDPYVEAFVVRVSRQIKATWGSSYDYPGTSSVTTLREYIEAASWPGCHAYSAYPDATVRTVEAALEIEKEHAFLYTLAHGAATTPKQFRIAYDGFLRRAGKLL